MKRMDSFVSLVSEQLAKKSLHTCIGFFPLLKISVLLESLLLSELQKYITFYSVASAACKTDVMRAFYVERRLLFNPVTQTFNTGYNCLLRRGTCTIEN